MGVCLYVCTTHFSICSVPSCRMNSVLIVCVVAFVAAETHNLRSVLLPSSDYLTSKSFRVLTDVEDGHVNVIYNAIMHRMPSLDNLNYDQIYGAAYDAIHHPDEIARGPLASSAIHVRHFEQYLTKAVEICVKSAISDSPNDYLEYGQVGAPLYEAVNQARARLVLDKMGVNISALLTF